ncbi:MAG: protein phosphatase 2C domain-containing protein [Bacteroidales bacterium]|nr:protein phosphatase 2C domain-containing protein [Bacteroidales bacterium]
METSKTKELTNFLYTSHTDKGAVRANNEDSSGYVDSVNGHVFVVCDGCGGLPCGEKASQTVVNSLKFFFTNYYYKDPVQAIKDAIDYAQNRLIEEGRQHPECTGMATTLVLVLVRYNKAYYASIGDSRIYFLAKGQLRQITKDDSYVQTLVDSGQITPEEAEHHPRKNELIQAMGMRPSPTPHICAQPLYPTDDEMILLCTDGLYNMVSAQDIHATLSRSGYIEDKGAELMRTAIANGGYDNITFQIIKFFNLENTTERTEQTPIISPQEAENAKRTPVALALLSIVIIILGVLMYLKEAKQDEQLAQNPSQNAYTDKDLSVAYNIRNYKEADSIAALYGISTSDATILTSIDGSIEMMIPIRKIHTARFYDNLSTLEKLYGVPKERIKAVNKLQGEALQPAHEIIIPL